MNQIKEILDIILSESDSWSAAPVFYSGRNLQSPTVDHFYLGLFPTSNRGVNLIMVDHQTVGFGGMGNGVQTFAAATTPPSDRFDFVGYRIFCPGRKRN